MIVTRRNSLSGKIHSMDLPITFEQIAAWKAGGLVQDVFPDLDPVDREFIINGITPEDWEYRFGGIDG